MTKRINAILVWEMFGALFIIITGSALHFVFQWTGAWPAIALVAAVNESVWEHLKLAFWPGVFWAFLPNALTKTLSLDRISAKGVSLLLTAIFIVVIFTTYTYFLGRNFLILDIGTFVFAVVAGQGLSAWLMSGKFANSLISRIGISLFSIQLVAYSLFTFFPPNHWLFIDNRTGLSGIPI